MKDKRRIRCESHYQVPRLSSETNFNNQLQSKENVGRVEGGAINQDISSDANSNGKMMHFDSTFCSNEEEEELKDVVKNDAFSENYSPKNDQGHRKNLYLLESRNGAFVMDPPPNVPMSYV
jgi:hypothetical protein